MPAQAFLMSSYTAEMVHGLDRASPPGPLATQATLAGPLPGRQPRTFSGHLHQPQTAATVRKRIDRGLPQTLEDLGSTAYQTLTGPMSL